MDTVKHPISELTGFWQTSCSPFIGLRLCRWIFTDTAFAIALGVESHAAISSVLWRFRLSSCVYVRMYSLWCALFLSRRSCSWARRRSTLSCRLQRMSVCWCTMMGLDTILRFRSDGRNNICFWRGTDTIGGTECSATATGELGVTTGWEAVGTGSRGAFILPLVVNTVDFSAGTGQELVGTGNLGAFILPLVVSTVNFSADDVDS